MSEGWGNFVEADLRQYLEEVTATLGNGREADDTSEMMVKNVIEEIEGKELRIATDAECSHHLEKLVLAASADDAAAILARLSDSETLFKTASNPFGSHVLEALLRRLANDPPGDADAAASLVEDLVQHLKDDLLDYITNKSGTFFARSLLQLLTATLAPSKPPVSASTGGLSEKIAHIQCVAGATVVGVPGADRAEGQAGGDDTAARHVRALAQVFLGGAVEDEAVVSLQRSTTASPFLQALLRAVDGTEVAEPFFLRMLGARPGGGETAIAAAKRIDAAKLIAQMKNKASSHFMEATLLRTPAPLFDVLWTLLKPKFPSLCVNPIANFAAQSLIAAVPASRFVADMVPLLKDKLSDTMHNKRSGVACVLAVAAAAWRTACSDMVEIVAAAFPDGVVPGLAMLDQERTLAAAAALDVRRPPRLSINGCILLQALLAMPQSACQAVSDALLDLPPEELLLVGRDPGGTRVLEAFLKGTAPRPMKNSLIEKLRPAYTTLAVLPAPSRLVEALFVWGDVPSKEVIAGALAPKLRELQGSKAGAPLCQVCQLEIWERSPDEWRRRVADNERTAAQFQKLFGDTAAASKKGRKDKRKRRGEDAPELSEGGGSGRVGHGAAHGGGGAPRDAALGKKKGCAQDVVGEVMAELGIARAAPEGGAQGGSKKKRKSHKARHRDTERSEGQQEKGHDHHDGGDAGGDEVTKMKKKKKRMSDV